MADAVIDASALVDMLIADQRGLAVRRRVRDDRLHAPAHLDAEVLSALGRIHRASRLSPERVGAMLAELASAPIVRHPLPDLLSGAWMRRERVRLADAVYLELADRLGVTLVTTDARLRAEPRVDVVRVAPADGEVGPSA